MSNEIENIYKMLYSPIVTPYNLLENAKLPNFSYVKYSKGDHGLIVEMKCFIENEGETVFIYFFDSEDKLTKVVMDNEIVFDRQAELDKALKRYKYNKSVPKKTAS